MAAWVEGGVVRRLFFLPFLTTPASGTVLETYQEFAESRELIALTVNGERVHVDAPDDVPLLWVLRDTPNLAGTAAVGSRNARPASFTSTVRPTIRASRASRNCRARERYHQGEIPDDTADRSAPGTHLAAPC